MIVDKVEKDSITILLFDSSPMNSSSPRWRAAANQLKQRHNIKGDFVAVHLQRRGCCLEVEFLYE